MRAIILYFEGEISFGSLQFNPLLSFMNLPKTAHLEPYDNTNYLMFYPPYKL